MTAPRRLLPAVALISAAALVPGAVLASTQAATAGATTGAGAHAAVTWDGWRGVSLGDTFTSAHRRLGGTLTRGSSANGGCGDLLTTATGSLDGFTYVHPHRVSDVRVNPSIAYPLGIRATTSVAKVKELVHASDFRLHEQRYDAVGNGSYQFLDTVVGPEGHTLYFSYEQGGNDLDRIGLAVNKHVAHQLLTINGC